MFFWLGSRFNIGEDCRSALSVKCSVGFARFQYSALTSRSVWIVLQRRLSVSSLIVSSIESCSAPSSSWSTIIIINVVIIPILHPQSSQSTLPDLSHKLDHQLIVETSHQGAVPLHNLSQLCDDKTIKLTILFPQTMFASPGATRICKGEVRPAVCRSE